ncbi:hypothetical protein [Streptomyces sp. W4I9-2]|uniref:hypothetical protein n=1 Tax=Streptomyces sp. W4I9-2 TaxID=3042297 RepID=UPI002788A6EB|nr:hypothetical protein [Streptomyces sp. W4I9-2]MDQ0694254.1 hypothetical protein [Streptomyces sp. W4I9-2]
MAVQNSTVERPALNDMSPADRVAHDLATYVRRPAQVSQETVVLPAATPARRRLIAQRRL